MQVLSKTFYRKPYESKVSEEQGGSQNPGSSLQGEQGRDRWDSRASRAEKSGNLVPGKAGMPGRWLTGAAAGAGWLRERDMTEQGIKSKSCQVGLELAFVLSTANWVSPWHPTGMNPPGMNPEHCCV